MLKLIQTEFMKNYNISKSIIILFLLLISSFLFISIENNFSHREARTESFSFHSTEYQVLKSEVEQKYKETKSIFDKDIVEITKTIKENFDITGKQVKYSYDEMWQQKCMIMYLKEVSHIYALKRVEKSNVEEINDYILSYENPGLADEYHIIKDEYIDYLNLYKNKNPSEKIEEVTKKIERLDNIIKEKNYGTYMNYYCEINDFSEENSRWQEYCDYFKENEIAKETDPRAINANQYFIIEDLKGSYHPLNQGKTVVEKKKNEITKEIYRNQEKILYYAYQKEMKHDLKFPSGGEDLYHIKYYTNTKDYANKGLSFGFIICLILIVTSSGILSKEHTKGTIKLLLTTPNKREKVILSKWIYLVLNVYILWIVGSILLWTISAIKYGYTDLFVNELVLFHGKVYEVNYVLWYLFHMFLHSIPVICLLSFLLFLSTTTKNIALTSSICSVTTFLSLIIWTALSVLNKKALYKIAYIPFCYIDYNIIRENSDSFIDVLANTNLPNHYGLWINAIFTLLFLGTSIYYYKKIDIVNKS